MNDNLKYFIEDMYDFIGAGKWNEFKLFVKEKGYNTEKIDALEEELNNFLND